jgi:hypothetical protein
MADDPIQFSYQNSDILGSWRHFNVCRFLHGDGIAEVAVHGSQVVKTIGVRHEMSVGELFGNLLQPAMQVAYIRTTQVDYFTICAENEAQDPMGAGVVRAHVEDHCLGC